MMHAILLYFILRISNSTKIDLGSSNPYYVVGEDIPKYNFFTLILKMNEDEKVIYDDITLSLLSLLGVGSTSYNDKSTEVIVNRAALIELDR
jgi:hypothetical protein